MYRTTGHLAVGARRQRYSFTRATALGRASRQHLESWSGILQADAYGGYGKLYDTERGPAPILEASCWAHARRKFYELADIAAAGRRKVQRHAPQTISPVSGSPCTRSKARRLVAALETGMREERRKLSRRSDVAGAIDYDGRVRPGSAGLSRGLRLRAARRI